MHVSLTINLISSLCKEIISKQYVDINFPTLAPFHYLLQTLYDLWPTLIQENKLLIYWRYAPTQFIEIVDHMSLTAFLTMTTDPQLYIILIDTSRKYPDLDNLLEILDLMELKSQKEQERNKYDLRCEGIDMVI
ncbi:hypothetical protein GWI33_022601 [Rhynchophorus ferrugineus]|uniref:Uncharacterized protein n=1 Tax=Rhynchophorus ferrugineus TaxID=354439 RepID=A0A834HPN9_RHYFE|nr:hypothetical protein GWI33_022601 [Rhynchophorus ferrugineus]